MSDYTILGELYESYISLVSRQYPYLEVSWNGGTPQFSSILNRIVPYKPSI